MTDSKELFDNHPSADDALKTMRTLLHAARGAIGAPAPAAGVPQSDYVSHAATTELRYVGGVPDDGTGQNHVEVLVRTTIWDSKDPNKRDRSCDDDPIATITETTGSGTWQLNETLSSTRESQSAQTIGGFILDRTRKGLQAVGKGAEERYTARIDSNEQERAIKDLLRGEKKNGARSLRRAIKDALVFLNAADPYDVLSGKLPTRGSTAVRIEHALKQMEALGCAWRYEVVADEAGNYTARYLPGPPEDTPEPNTPGN